MKFIYPAVIRQDEDLSYHAYFPDLDGCIAQGSTIDEVLEEANAAMTNWIQVELEDENAGLPPVSDPSDLILNKGEFIRNICITYRFTDGWEE